MLSPISFFQSCFQGVQQMLFPISFFLSGTIDYEKETRELDFYSGIWLSAAASVRQGLGTSVCFNSPRTPGGTPRQSVILPH